MGVYLQVEYFLPSLCHWRTHWFLGGQLQLALGPLAHGKVELVWWRPVYLDCIETLMKASGNGTTALWVCMAE